MPLQNNASSNWPENKKKKAEKKYQQIDLVWFTKTSSNSCCLFAKGECLLAGKGELLNT